MQNAYNNSYINLIAEEGYGVIRKGRFAIWKKREFELESSSKQFYLRSYVKEDEKEGFKKSSGNELIYLKAVSVNELEDAYEIIPYALISGYRFAVDSFSQETGMFSLITNNPFVQEKLKVRPHGKFEYIIEVSKDEVELIEDRMPILGFEESD